MKDFGTEISEKLKLLRGKPASYVTHALKEFGGGDDATMVDGLINLVNQLNEDKKISISKVKLQYGLGGAGIATATIGLYHGTNWLHSKYNKWKIQNQENLKYIQILDKEIEMTNIEENSTAILTRNGGRNF